MSDLLALRVARVLDNDVPSVYHARNPSQETEKDVDEKVGPAASSDHHWERREEDRNDYEDAATLQHW